MPESSPPATPNGRRRSPARRLLSLNAFIYALALTLVLVPLALNVFEAVVDPLLEYKENGQKVTLRPDDGCLKYRRALGARAGTVTQRDCGWQRPEGVAEWAPQTRELLVLDPAKRHVVELVAYGMVPDETKTVRYTLPGGEIVEPAVRHRDDLDHPAFWIHLTRIAIPVDLRAVDGAPAFERFQIFDTAGNEIATV
ncbi:hypothetical protein DMB66_21770 [Actinoplanes sp. ATCC 53533]|uniref:hypothetical protein n=1 Tax=Actinoplanes sp. ATCC 53533 TaxID=1288362 RepID=UPI000F78CBF4|nr:hypothetical protein [Actinoplanes sp. ATCC 53533]RSM63961.1 hypothetical protein DMB66_21770 [Actinoplanes sp. ATCC 53533]